MSERRFWSEEEIRYLKENYQFKDNNLLAKALDRDRSAIASKLNQLGLKRSGVKGLQREGYKYINYSNWNTKVDTPCALLMPCSKCDQLKPCDSFYILGTRRSSNKSKGRLDILDNPRGLHCYECGLDNYKAYTNEKKLMYAATQRANRMGRKCSISVEDIFIPVKCPILGLKLSQMIGGGKMGGVLNANAPSLDRVENSKGYTKDNICVISRRANTIKRDGELEEFLAITAFLAEFRMGNIDPRKEVTPYKERSLDEIIDILTNYKNYLERSSNQNK